MTWRCQRSSQSVPSFSRMDPDSTCGIRGGLGGLSWGGGGGQTEATGEDGGLKGGRGGKLGGSVCGSGGRQSLGISQVSLE